MAVKDKVMAEDFQLKYRGLLMGAGTAFKIESIDGLESFASRPDDVPFARGHGEASGRYYSTYKLITIKLSIVGDGQTHADNIDKLMAAFSTGGTVLAGEDPKYPDRKKYYDTTLANDFADQLVYKRPI